MNRRLKEQHERGEREKKGTSRKVMDSSPAVFSLEEFARGEK
jgi:hypothetical protein